MQRTQPMMQGAYDEYTCDYLNNQLRRRSMDRWEIKLSVSPTRTIGKKPKYANANWME